MFELTLNNPNQVIEDENDDVPVSLRGPPKKSKAYNTNSTRATNAWWHYWHGRPLTSTLPDLIRFWLRSDCSFLEQALAELLDIISDPLFLPEEVAPTPYLLEECDEFFFHSIPTAKLDLVHEGVKEVLEYHPLEEILKYTLNNDKLMNGNDINTNNKLINRCHRLDCLSHARWPPFILFRMEGIRRPPRNTTKGVWLQAGLRCALGGQVPRWTVSKQFLHVCVCHVCKLQQRGTARNHFTIH